MKRLFVVLALLLVSASTAYAQPRVTHQETAKSLASLLLDYLGIRSANVLEPPPPPPPPRRITADGTCGIDPNGGCKPTP
jgi:hypothetical protein